MRALRQALPFLLAVLLGGTCAFQSTTTRGYVQDAADRPISGADVLLADSIQVVARVRTNPAGQFRFIHPPMERERYQLLICAPGYGSMYVDSAHSALISSTYGLDSKPGAAFWTPERLGWSFAVPESCPGERTLLPSRAALPWSTVLSAERPMRFLADVFGSLGFLLLFAALYALPLLLIVWFVRTLSQLQRDQERLVRLVASIEEETRRRATQELWNRERA